MARQKKREIHLTDRSVEGLEPEERPARWNDTKQAGFTCVVSPNGKKRFRVRYVTADGKNSETVLGEFPTLNTKRARELAQKKRAEVLEGADPAEERRKKRAAGTTKRKRTLAALVELYLADTELRGSKAESTMKKERQHLEGNIVPRLGHMPVSQIKRTDIKEALYDIRDAAAERSGKSGTSAANDCRKYLSLVIDHGVELEWLEGNPVTLVKKFEEQHRERTATEDELEALWNRWETRKRSRRSSGWSGAAALQFELLTLQRGEEVVSMTWDEIDFKNALWSLPSGRKKERRAASVPLSPAALAILEEAWERGLSEAEEDSSSTASERKQEALGPFQGREQGTLKRNSLTQAARRDCKALEIENLTPHDLRRTGRTAITDPTRLGFPPHIGEAVLNHAVGSTLQRTYDKNTYITEKRSALDAWAQYVLQVVGDAHAGESSNVVPMAGRA